MGEALFQCLRSGPDTKLPASPHGDARCRKERIVIAPKLVFAQIQDPLPYNRSDFVAHREKEGCKGLAELGLFPTSVIQQRRRY
jgi:hypothetical protein